MKIYQSEMTVPAEAAGVDGVRVEDQGRAMVLYAPATESETIPAGGLHARLMSWDESGAHAGFRRLMGKRVRVTVELLDD